MAFFDKKKPEYYYPGQSLDPIQRVDLSPKIQKKSPTKAEPKHKTNNLQKHYLIMCLFFYWMQSLVTLASYFLNGSLIPIKPNPATIKIMLSVVSNLPQYLM